MMRRIILIGGAPTVGKSTLARSLSKKLDLPWISTDHLRTVMRAVANPLDLPKLFTPESHSAEAFFDKFSAQEVVQIELDQGEAAWPGICEFIKLDYCWSEGFIIEGVNILPHLVAKNFKDSKEVKAVFLVDGDRERTRDIIFT
ncbi:MAG: hypothetical protein KDD56_05455, partial [Bdellovibrionales bacterium]|nr:hypothetical protein [Bdellovibrionales bacterium]